MKTMRLRMFAPTSNVSGIARDLLDQFYVRVLGFMYQVLGDAELAAQATELVFTRQPTPADETAIWSAAVEVMQSYVARGFAVRPLVSSSHTWQADLLRGLARLTPLERAIVILRYHEGLSSMQLADVLDEDEAAVRAQVAAARRRLLDEIADL